MAVLLSKRQSGQANPVSIFKVWLRDTAIDARVIQVVFVGLAALAVPLMGIVERVQFVGWVRKPYA